MDCSGGHDDECDDDTERWPIIVTVDTDHAPMHWSQVSIMTHVTQAPGQHLVSNETKTCINYLDLE